MVEYLKVSVVVPAYNGSGTVRECVGSVLASDYPTDSIEVVVVDDGSRDDTYAVLRELEAAHKQVRVVKHERNLGAARARDTGIKQATGDVVCVLSQDTFADASWLRRVADRFGRDPRLGIVQGIVKRTGEIEFPFHHVTERPAFSWSFPTVAIAYRAEALDRAGRYFDPVFSEYGDDTDIAWRIIEAGYGWEFLDVITAYHGVYRVKNGFVRDIRRSFPAPAIYALLIRRHPGIRQFLYQGFLWSSPARVFNTLLFPASVAVAVATSWTYGIGLVAVAIALGVYRLADREHVRIPMRYRYVVLPVHRLLCEVLGFASLVYGTIRYRSLVL
ncbi:MAG TPA: glycosyltransferase family 2 protein [Methylomirabilota bacterium]|nr:glycosyltransferase family 2 protein [Methylomirabilota bacterium]